MDAVQIAMACGSIGVGLYSALQGRLFAEQTRRVDRMERHDDESQERLRDLELSNAELVQRCNALTSRNDELERRVDQFETATVRKREFDAMNKGVRLTLTSLNRGIWRLAQGKALSEMPAAPGLSGDFE